MLSGSLTRAPSQMRSRKRDQPGSLGGRQRVGVDGQGGLEPLVGVALVDESRVDVEDDALDGLGQRPGLRGIAHVGSLRGIQ